MNLRSSLYTGSALYSLLIFFLLACGENSEDQAARIKIPDNVLSQNAFAKVLTDFALAESVVNLNIKNVAASRMDTVYAFNPLKENHVSKAKYDSTVLFYTKHTELYKKVYEVVLVALSEIQTRRDSLVKVQASKKHIDSLTAVQASKHIDSLAKLRTSKRTDSLRKVRLSK